ncbi:MAG: HK97 family phage prohead protease [Sphingomonas sp.]|uniref:HK97 family phage prohead protease n=1 Tax=Sphingomonas sp. TaxID=28214 RepID=UPI00182BC8A0|nr:HK97 family phage prohead protease [Sphingomonas sp.]MBA3667938.1 HK97 family phage prohead protease [Sphingomonas sp.]
MTARIPPAVERRSFSEVRAVGRKLEGYAATFNSEARLGSFVETIAPGAFRSALAGDVLALMDHDPGKVLGRTRSGTLKLFEDTRGLGFSLDVPDTQAGRDVLALAERADLGGMSFGFTVPKGGEDWNGEKRTLRQIGLKEISVVSAWPAYPDTEIALRALQRGAEAHRRARVLIMAELAAWG